MPKRRTLLVLGALPPPLHGAALYYQNLIRHPKFHDAFRICFLNLNMGNVLSSYQKFSISKVLRTCIFLCRYIFHLTTQRIDIVYANVAFPKYPFIKDSLFAILGKAFRKNIVGCVLGAGLQINYQRSSRLMRAYYRLIGRLYTGFITPGLEMSRADFEGVFPTGRLRCVPFGIPPVLKKKREINSLIDCHNLLYMSNFFSAKGVFDVLKSIKYVTARHSNVRFIFAGEWMTEADEARSQAIVEGDGVSGFVEFVGKLTGQKKRDMLSRCDIFLLPTYYEFEGLPLAILDAMSCGLFVITTDHAAISEVIKDGKNGLFCKKNDPIDLAQKIVAAIENPDFTAEVRARNQDEFYRSYTQDHFVDRLISELKYLCREDV